MKSGIYLIESPSGGQYVGSAVNLTGRRNGHFSALRRGCHQNRILQNAWEKYGDRLIFRVLLICRKEDRLFYEQRTIDALRPRYNILSIAGSPAGHKFGPPSPETIAKLAAQKGWKHTEQSKLKMRGRIRSSSHLEALSRAAMGQQRRLGIKGVGGNCRPLKCIETDQVFASMGIASDWLKDTGKSKAKDCSAVLSLAANGHRKSAFGYTWRLLDYEVRAHE